MTGERATWSTLQELVLPTLERWARSHSGLKRRGLHRSEDDVRDVIVASLERLRRGGQAYLASPDQAAEGAFSRWLYGALDFAVRQHLRERFGRIRKLPAEPGALGPSKRDLNTLAGRYEEDEQALSRTGLTGEMTLRQVMTHVTRTFARDEALALTLYIERDASFEEVSDVLGLGSAADAERLIRKLKERLRVYFRDRS